jgi:hypothetical protein
MKKLIGVSCLIFSLLAALTSCVSPAVKSRWVNPNTDKTMPSNCCPPAAPNVKTQKKANGAKAANAEPLEGIAYSLPMVQFHLTAILTNVPDVDAPPVTVVTTLISNSYTTTTYLNQTNADAIYYVTNADKKIYTNANFVITNTTVQVVSNSATVPGVNTNTLKKAYIVTIDPIIAPDPDHLYALKMTEDKVSSDTFGLSVDPTNNFLQSVNATNADQTVNIIASLAQATVSIYTMGAGGGLPAGGLGVNPSILGLTENKNKDATPPKLKKHLPGRIEIIFDPTTPDDLTAANQQLTKLLVNQNDGSEAEAEDICPIILRVKFQGNIVSQKTQDYLFQHRPKRANGVLYRPMLPYTLEVYNNHGVMGVDSVQYLLRTPNAAPVFSLPVNRATFVTRTTSINFNNGFLQGVNYNNPSQTAAVLGLPLMVVGDVFSSVTNVLQLKLNIATQQSNIATQQTALVNQMAALNYASSNLLNSATQLNAFKTSLTNKP